MSKISAFPSPGREGQSPNVPPIPDIPKQTILDYLAAIGLSSELTEAERTQFVSVCQAFGLNPFKREVYATVYGEGSYRRFSVIVGYEVYLKRADRSGKLDGWSSRIEGSGDDMKAIVEIHRRDWSEPLVHEVHFVEAVQKKKDGTPIRLGRRCRASSSRRSASPRPSASASRMSSAGSRRPSRRATRRRVPGLRSCHDLYTVASRVPTRGHRFRGRTSGGDFKHARRAATSARGLTVHGRPFIRSPAYPLPRLPGPVPRRAPERSHRSPDGLPR